MSITFPLARSSLSSSLFLRHAPRTAAFIATRGYTTSSNDTIWSARRPGMVYNFGQGFSCARWSSEKGRKMSGNVGASNRRRWFSASPTSFHETKGKPPEGQGVTLNFAKHDGTLLKTVKANEGDDMVDVSWEWDLDIEAACEKSIACSTCHVILDPEIYDSLPEPTDEENDMLDLAFGLTDTSRLGCQVKVTKEMEGMTIRLPSATRNMRIDGSKPTPH